MTRDPAFCYPTVQIPHPFAAGDPGWEELEIPVDAFSCDQFRMLEFKVRRCVRGRSHDWTDCPFAHPGEKARRRDPLKYAYSGASCPDYQKGGAGCRKGDACEYAHGVFESWLHPDRYRTLPCKDGTHCRRRVCFFAHTPDQLRLAPADSPTSVLHSPSGLALSMRDLQRSRAEFDPPMQRVESGRDLRERMYAKLCMENSVDSVPDFGWIAELVS